MPTYSNRICDAFRILMVFVVYFASVSQHFALISCKKTYNGIKYHRTDKIKHMYRILPGKSTCACDIYLFEMNKRVFSAGHKDEATQPFHCKNFLLVLKTHPLGAGGNFCTVPRLFCVLKAAPIFVHWTLSSLFLIFLTHTHTHIRTCTHAHIHTFTHTNQRSSI